MFGFSKNTFRSLGWLLVASLFLTGALSGCQVFNDSCPVGTPEVWGKGLPTDLDIRKEYIRQCEAPVGNFLADAILNYDYKVDLGSSHIHVALINAGAIRDGVACGSAISSRDRIPKGPITDQDILQLLPFVDTVVIVKMKGSQLKRVLEHSVSSLNLSGEQGQEGHFLQVAGKDGIKIEVDCSRPAQTLNETGTGIVTPGERIVSMRYGENLEEIIPTGDYYVATLDYLVGDDDGVPNDGFVGFHFKAENESAPPEVMQTYIPIVDVVHYWLGNYETNITKEYPDDPDILKTYPSTEGRLVYSSCEELAGICIDQ